MSVQFIKTPSGDDMVILPKADYEKLLAVVDDDSDLADIQLFQQRLAAGDEELIPADVVNRLIEGENKVRVWREYRGMTAKELAVAASVSAGYLSQIETGARDGTIDVMKRIAAALGVTLDEIA